MVITASAALRNRFNPGSDPSIRSIHRRPGMATGVCGSPVLMSGLVMAAPLSFRSRSVLMPTMPSGRVSWHHPNEVNLGIGAVPGSVKRCDDCGRPWQFHPGTDHPG
jgi:hypothetical protein